MEDDEEEGGVDGELQHVGDEVQVQHVYTCHVSPQRNRTENTKKQRETNQQSEKNLCRGTC